MKVHNIKYIESVAGKSISEVSNDDKELIKKTLGYCANDLGENLTAFCSVVQNSGFKMLSRKKQRKEDLLEKE